MAIQHEVAFETELCEYLAEHGWKYSPNGEGYDRDRDHDGHLGSGVITQEKRLT
ncbi:MAG TPA: hypothetical protein VIJ18_07355 [Microbacteriaceae bacterium]